MTRVEPLSESRRFNMSRIHGKDTRPEEIVRKYLFSRGFRYRKNDKKLPGKPDIVLPKYKTVIFVNGCFWHMHKCKFFVWPKHNADFWRAKIEETVKRDERKTMELEDAGWRVLIIWECDLKERQDEALAGLTDSILEAETASKQLQ